MDTLKIIEDAVNNLNTSEVTQLKSILDMIDNPPLTHYQINGTEAILKHLKLDPHLFDDEITKSKARKEKNHLLNRIITALFG